MIRQTHLPIRPLAFLEGFASTCPDNAIVNVTTRAAWVCTDAGAAIAATYFNDFLDTETTFRAGAKQGQRLAAVAPAGAVANAGPAVRASRRSRPDAKAADRTPRAKSPAMTAKKTATAGRGAQKAKVAPKTASGRAPASKTRAVKAKAAAAPAKDKNFRLDPKTHVRLQKIKQRYKFPSLSSAIDFLLDSVEPLRGIDVQQLLNNPLRNFVLDDGTERQWYASKDSPDDLKALRLTERALIERGVSDSGKSLEMFARDALVRDALTAISFAWRKRAGVMTATASGQPGAADPRLAVAYASLVEAKLPITPGRLASRSGTGYQTADRFMKRYPNGPTEALIAEGKALEEKQKPAGDAGAGAAGTKS